MPNDGRPLHYHADTGPLTQTPEMLLTQSRRLFVVTPILAKGPRELVHKVTGEYGAGETVTPSLPYLRFFHSLVKCSLSQLVRIHTYVYLAHPCSCAWWP